MKCPGSFAALDRLENIYSLFRKATEILCQDKHYYYNKLQSTFFHVEICDYKENLNPKKFKFSIKVQKGVTLSIFGTSS
jgi:hypothetical protein